MISNKIISTLLGLQQDAIASGNPPFAAVIIVDDQVIASTHNKSRSSGNPLQHAEMLAIQSAIENHGSAILQKAHLISTNEPCPMCMGACIWSGIRKVTYFVSQEQVAAIRGWGKFMPAHEIAEVDDSGIIINGPIENVDMRNMHHDYWTTEKNSQFKHSIHLLGDKIERSK
jgi:tRNA(Arg) A34 adenosine deaminase TadA